MIEHSATGTIEASRGGKDALHPYWILLAAILLPGSGHVLCGQPARGLSMQMFMICLGFITWQLTTPDHSMVGRLAGGLFVYTTSVLEAYRIARVRYATLASGGSNSPGRQG